MTSDLKDVPVTTPESDIAAHRSSIAREAARLEEDATYASKSHFNDAAFWDSCHIGLGLAATLLGVAAGATALFSNTDVAAVVSFLSAGATAVLTFQKPAERALAHRKAGNAYAQVRRRARQLHTVDAIGPDSNDTLRKALVEIEAMRSKIDDNTPGPSDRSFKRARMGIEDGEASHVADKRAD